MKNNWLGVSAGRAHTVALKKDGFLYSWGWNYYGQLGNGKNGHQTDIKVPTQIGKSVQWDLFAARGDRTILIKPDGTFEEWGKNVDDEMSTTKILN